MRDVPRVDEGRGTTGIEGTAGWCGAQAIERGRAEDRDRDAKYEIAQHTVSLGVRGYSIWIETDGHGLILMNA